MSDWFARQFGDKEHFAITVSFGRDPHPIGSAGADATWGGFGLWARGRCLTRSVSEDSGVSDEVRWNLLGILEWVIDAGARLVDEEPLPLIPALDAVRDASDWFNDTERPPLQLTEREEDEWFRDRSDWRQHHGLRRAATEAALPNVIIRRLGDFLEVSWDNESWGSGRPGLSFVEKRGSELVGARLASSTIAEMTRVVTRELAERNPALAEFVPLAEAAQRLAAEPSDWKWLVPRPTAQVIARALPDLRAKLEAHAADNGSGLFIPHTPETLALRHARLTTGRDVRQLLDAAAAAPPKPTSPTVRQLLDSTPAPTVNPYKAGYAHAERVRERLGWGDGPAPDLATWMGENDILTRQRALPPGVVLVAVRDPEARCSAAISTRVESPLRSETAHATALGHLLMDGSGISVDGTWEHWPTAARARAFGVMLLLPAQGVKGELRGRKSLAAEDVQRLMTRFKTGPWSTTYHLKNLGLIDEERRHQILRDMGV